MVPHSTVAFMSEVSTKISTRPHDAYVVAEVVVPLLASIHGSDPGDGLSILCNGLESGRIERRPLASEVAIREPLRRLDNLAQGHLSKLATQSCTRHETYPILGPGQDSGSIELRVLQRKSTEQVSKPTLNLQRAPYRTPCSNSSRRPGGVRSSWPKVEVYPRMNSRLAGSFALCSAADAFASVDTRPVMDASSPTSGRREPCRCICAAWGQLSCHRDARECGSCDM